MDLKDWTPDRAPRLDGRRAVVTGASGGLGFETALGLARRGARVVIAARDPAKAEAARRRIAEAVPGALLLFVPLDLADLAAVARFADVVGRDGPLDILVNNAGVMAFPTRRVTRDGFEEQFGTNYLGHFALTARLLPALTAARDGGRVVGVASLAHREGRIALDDLNAERRYDPWAAYRQSKLAMLIFARELERRAEAAGWRLRSVAAHPGWAVTDIIANGPGRAGGLKPRLMRLAFNALAQPARAGALPILYAATAPEAEGGGSYGPGRFDEKRGPVAPSRVMPQARDPGTAAALWEASERLTGATFGVSGDAR